MAESSQRLSRVAVGGWLGSLGLLGATFLLTRATLLGELMPFGPGILIALAGHRPRLLWPAVLTAGAGLYGVAAGIEAYLRLAVFVALGIALSLPQARRLERGIAVAALGTAVIILIRGLGQAFLGPSFYGWVLLLFEAVLAGGLALAWLEAGVSRHREERLLGLSLFALGLLLGLEGWQVAGMSLQSLVGRLFILAAAIVGGAGSGAAMGAVLGFLPSLTSLTAPALAGLLALVGLTAGAFHSLGKLGVVGGFMLAHLLLSSYFLGAQGANLALKESAVVALVVLLWPTKWIKPATSFFNKEGPESAASPPIARAQRLAAALKFLGESLENAVEAGTGSAGAAVRQVARLVCEGCPANKVCWELDGDKLTSALKDLLVRKGTAGLVAADLPGWLQGRCGRARELLAALEAQARKFTPEQAAQGLAPLLARQFRALGSLLEDSLRETAAAGEAAAKEPFLRVEVGYTSCARQQDLTCGDSFLAAPLEEGRYLLVLSDGMGAGREARRTSHTAVELVKELLAAGFSRELALRLVNMVLLLRSPRESFATLDMAVLDLNQGQAEFTKLGACSGFLVRGQRVLTIKPQSLPVGILEDIPLEVSREEIQPGDVLVMVSDGVLEAHRDPAEKDRWVAAALKRATESEPQRLAERLLNQAVALAGGSPADDMLVAVARLEQVGRT
ncbi:MAG: SpoIIE family protein phosphatase [Thermoanaerobacteraceae bacterium]|nr:SpoIIE family protein phosphatase [Thermoanaerobacteraceae bacterium]